MGRHRALTAQLAAAGFVAAEEEADELLAAAVEDADALEAMVARRLAGEPLAWITGTTVFCGLTLAVHPGVYVPRWQTEALAERAAARRPERALDLCTGCGAVAAVLQAGGASVVATDVDSAAVANARANGVDARCADLLGDLREPVDVVTGVVPYVPTEELALLQRDTLAFEDPRSYDGGPAGTALLQRAVDGARAVLRPGGALLLELGGDQAQRLDLGGYAEVVVLRDEEGDVRGVEARVGSRA